MKLEWSDQGAFVASMPIGSKEAAGVVHVRLLAIGLGGKYEESFGPYALTEPFEITGVNLHK